MIKNHALAKPVVLNKKYRFLLKKILSSRVPQVDIESVMKFSPDTLFIDVREKTEYNISTIKGSLNLTFSTFHIDDLKGIAFDRKLLIFCSVGLRSEKICTQALQAGYTSVYNLYGGIFEWINRGLPVVGADGRQAGCIHGFSPLWGIWVSGLKKVYG